MWAKYIVSHPFISLYSFWCSFFCIDYLSWTSMYHFIACVQSILSTNVCSSCWKVAPLLSFLLLLLLLRQLSTSSVFCLLRQSILVGFFPYKSVSHFLLIPVFVFALACLWNASLQIMASIILSAQVHTNQHTIAQSPIIIVFRRSAHRWWSKLHSKCACQRTNAHTVNMH